jgi:hypothetical protein
MRISPAPALCSSRAADVHRVPRGAEAVLTGLVHHDLARVHAHAHLELDPDPLEPLVEPAELRPELVCGT